MSAERLDAGRTALLLFDLLEGHVNKDAASRARFDPVIANAALLLARAREMGAMVIYAKADHRADRSTSALTLRDTDNRLRPLRPGDRDGPLLTGGTQETEVVKEVAPRPVCPSCGSAHTQPFTHAGPGARVNMKCIDCGHLFRDRTTRR